MRISDWSSDVCSSDLDDGTGRPGRRIPSADRHPQVEAGKPVLHVGRHAGIDIVGIHGALLPHGPKTALSVHLFVAFHASRRLFALYPLHGHSAGPDRKSTRLTSSYYCASRMPSSP